MCSSEFTYKWHLTVNDLIKLKTLFIIFLILNAPVCSLTEDKQNTTKQINTFRTEGHQSCNQTIQSPVTGSKKGTFSAPRFTHENNLTEHSHSCIYMFIAQPNEQVSITFTSFKLNSFPPECKHEFVDFYTDLNNEEMDLKNATLTSRNCGSQIPKQRISLKQRLAFVYNNDQKSINNDTNLKFEGNYEFIKSEPFTLNNRTDKICDFEIKSREQRDGTLQSLTYPGIYNSPLDCTYKFKGETGQRIKIEFHDFDLFFGGLHCPFDYVKIFDGDNNSAPIIGTYCGQKRSFIVFSTGPTLLIQFKSTKRLNKAENRGFSAWFEFSDKFVNLGFIEKNNGELILGTECDQRIFSKGEQYSNYLISPNYPFNYPSSTECTYYLYGLYDKFILQNIRIQFEKFDMPNNHSNECSEAALRIHTANPINEEPDYVFCETEQPPSNLASDGAIMVLVFKTSNNLPLNGQGFKLQYTFETDYRISEGIHQSPGCNFLYKSTFDKKAGYFNSPRYPSSYPAQITCTYEFRPLVDEQVMLIFQNFRLHKEGKSVALNLSFKSYELNPLLDVQNGYGDEACIEDWVDVYELPLNNIVSERLALQDHNSRKTRSENVQLNQNSKLFSLNFDNLIDDQILDRDKPLIDSQEQWVKLEQDQSNSYLSQNKLGRWCSRSAPGPIVTSKAGSILKVIFKTDLIGFSSGFLSTYSFKKSSNFADKCDYQFNSESVNNSSKSNKLFGIISSPNWPKPYKSIDKLCNWSIKVKKGYRILLEFQSFLIEGDMRERGCSNAVVRIWKSQTSIPFDLCGGNLANNTRNVLSEENFMKISFISSTKSIGATGFKAVFTEISDDLNQCDQFKCKKNLICIHSSLRCNSINNCGYDDKSDEEGC